MKSIQTCLAVLLVSLWAFAQTPNHTHYGTTPKTTQPKTTQSHHTASNNAVASETIAAANRDIASQQRELTQIERGSTAHVKRSAPAHPATVKAPKEHSAPNAPINFAYHPPKQQNSRPPSGRAYSAR